MRAVLYYKADPNFETTCTMCVSGVNPGVTQPRDHSLADPCISMNRNSLNFGSKGGVNSLLLLRELWIKISVEIPACSSRRNFISHSRSGANANLQIQATEWDRRAMGRINIRGVSERASEFVQ